MPVCRECGGKGKTYHTTGPRLCSTCHGGTGMLSQSLTRLAQLSYDSPEKFVHKSVLAAHRAGATIEQIVQSSGLPEDQVSEILEELLEDE